ncbi:hypothetical protein BDB00DRAFT_413751 [Zychaea mexicana]|uniref:uncharacterized protein n=1 Tax=Zychaea mexicana TaxID=64656 RepID=UPI0022FF332F|nr:uncharacterized protein BDB00DRAFT_413751 [Zychaea mexicana]KAI9492921.1 hypothetical protein BDB00DRAFT_413751 [Zychaea mexicana]
MDKARSPIITQGRRCMSRADAGQRPQDVKEPPIFVTNWAGRNECKIQENKPITDGSIVFTLVVPEKNKTADRPYHFSCRRVTAQFDVPPLFSQGCESCIKYGLIDILYAHLSTTTALLYPAIILISSPTTATTIRMTPATRRRRTRLKRSLSTNGQDSHGRCTYW